LQRLVKKQPELRRAPLIIYEEYRQGCFRVVDCSASAFAKGARYGMPLAEATAFVAAHLERFDPHADLVALKKLAAWCERFSPSVATEESDCLTMDMTGLTHLFGSEQAIATDIMQAFRKIGLIIRIAICDSFAGAWALCHASDRPVVIVPRGELSKALEPLPVAALKLGSDTVTTLNSLGVEKIGQLLAIPRDGLAERFDPALLQRLDQVMGRAPETIIPHRPVPELTAEIAWEYGVTDRFVLSDTINNLLGEVTPLLAMQRRGIIAFDCALHSENEQPVYLSVGLYQATANTKHLSELADLQLEKLTLKHPVDKIRLLVSSTALLSTSQLELFDEGNALERQRHLSILVDRLSSRLGQAGVLRATLVADAQAEHAYRYRPVRAEKRRTKPVAPPGPLQRPLVMYRDPVPLEVLGIIPNGPPIRFSWQGEQVQVVRHFGPERLAVGWWRGAYIQRDYYRVETSVGTRFWLYRRVDGKWFLHGIFN
jgi:protein ImuB